MDLIPYLEALKASDFSLSIQYSAWAFPVIESAHVVAITLVFGIIAIVDLRLLGVASVSRRLSEVSRDCLGLTWVFFALAVVTGLLMFVTNAPTYFENTWFRWKMLFIALAGVNMLIFELITVRGRSDWDDGSTSVPASGRFAGLLSIAFWFGVILCGRMIGFTLYQLPF